MPHSPAPTGAPGFPWRENLPLLALLLVAALSCLLLWMTNSFWRDSFHTYLPALSSLRMAKAEMLKGYLNAQKAMGEEAGVRPEDQAAYFEQARQHALDVAEAAALLDEPARGDMAGRTLAEQIRNYAALIERFASLTDQRLRTLPGEREALGVDQRRMFSQLEKLGGELDQELERRFNALAEQQDRFGIVLLVLWLGFLALLVVAMAAIGSRQRQAAAALRSSELRYRTLAERSQDGILILEGSPPRAAYANSSLGQLWGYAPAEICAMAPAEFLDMVHPADREQVSPMLDEHPPLRENRSRWSFRILRKDGETRWVDVSGSHVNVGGRMLGQYIFRDITAQVRLREDLVSARNQADDANRAKSEFLATMSHEIRTPLNGVMSMIELTQAESLDSRQREYLRIALDSARKLLTILNDILDLSRIESGRVELASEPFNLRAMVQDLCTLFQEQARMKGLALELDMDAALPPVLVGDEVRLRQLLFNVMGNAVKFTQAGAVLLGVAYLPARPDRAAALLLTVEDSGIGIPREKLDSIFQPFTQANGAFTRNHGGAGLGLAIVRRLVNLMGGALCIESEPGRGTFLHCQVRGLAEAGARPPAPAPTAPPRPYAAAGRNLRLLLAEDDRVNQLAIRIFLERLGHSPSCAANGQEALDLFHSRAFDCILMDINMPVMDGVEATHRIRAAEPGGPTPPDVPIVAITAYAAESDRVRLLASGMDGFIPKPADMDDIRTAIDAAMAGRRRT